MSRPFLSRLSFWLEAASSHLAMLDEMIRVGLQHASDSFIDTQVRFLAGRQQPDGGFCGRQGGSDLYYTDFALRSLALLAPGHPAFGRAVGYLEQQVGRARSVVECFGILNVCRMLWKKGSPLPPTAWRCPGEGQGVRVASTGPARQHVSATGRISATDRSALRDVLRAYLLSNGGIARSAGIERVSAYDTFIAVLCFQMLGEPMPAVEGAIRAVETLSRPDGGFAALEGEPTSQTSATAAAIGFLTMHNALSPERTTEAIRFFSEMQSIDGGLKAHAAAASGDLLSTFTGLVTLAMLNGLQEINTARAAKFLRSLALPDGGFLACIGDDAADVEYTYYGIGVFALLAGR